MITISTRAGNVNFFNSPLKYCEHIRKIKYYKKYEVFSDENFEKNKILGDN